jgi:iron complex outermembrane receptor protein
MKYLPTTPFQLAGGLAILMSSSVLADNKVQFNIPAQSLSQSLLDYSQVTGIKILFNENLARNIKNPALNGDYTTEEALKKLLGNSGLDYHFTSPKAVVLNQPKAENQSEAPLLAEVSKESGPTTLPKVNVVGNSIYDARDPYNEDYVLPNATSGTKTDTPIMETPLNVQVVSKQVLKDQQVIGLNQALSNVSGVVTAPRDGVNGNNFYLRGFATSTYFRNGFRIDNVAQTSMDFNDRQFANVESIEVLKGSSAILYGRVEPGGMVNVITKQPLATPYFSLNQQFGSYNTYRTSIDSTGPITHDDALLYRVNMSYQNQGNFRDYVNYENFFLAPILKWNISSQTQATLEMEYQHGTAVQNTGLAPALNGQLINIPYNRNYYDPSGLNIVDSYFIGFNWSHQFNNDWSIKHRVQVNKNDTATNHVQTAPQIGEIGGVPVFQPTSQGGSSSNDTYSTGIDLTGHFNTGILKHKLLFGGDYYRYSLDQISINQGVTGVNLLNPVYPGMFISAPDPTQNFAAQNQVDNYGVYLQDQIELPFHIHLLGGMRYQYIHDNYKFQDPGYSVDQTTILTAVAITPRAGLLWQPQSWLSVYGNYTEGFGVNSGVMAGGNPVPPTSAKQYEIGAKTEFFDGRLRASFAYYELSKTNIGTPNPNADLALLGYSVVTGEARSRGPELDIQGEILPGWNVLGNYTNTDATVTKSNNGDVGNRFYNVPRNMGKIWSVYEVQQGDAKGLKLGGGVTMQDTLIGGFAGYTQPISGYATVSLMSGYSLKVGKAKISAQLNVENLLDKHYYTGGVNYLNVIPPTASGYNYTFMSYGMPRTLMGSINIQY